MFWTAPCLCGILKQIPKDREVATAMPNDMPTQTTATRETFLRAAVAAYHLEPESLWAKSPRNLVLRRPDNRKWFAVLLEVPRAALGLAGEGRADLLNLKCGDPLLRDLLLARPGYLPDLKLLPAAAAGRDLLRAAGAGLLTGRLIGWCHPICSCLM